VRRITALACAKDLIALLVLRFPTVGERRGSLQDNARELGAGDPGEGRLVLVFAADLEQIEEVGCRGMDREEVLVRLGGWCGEIDDLEFFWSLGTFRWCHLNFGEIRYVP